MLIGLNDYSDTDLFHMGSQINLEMLDAAIDALTDDEVTEDDIWIPSEMYGYMEYYAYIFDDAVCNRSVDVINNVLMGDDDNWGSGKMSRMLATYPLTKELNDLFYDQGKTDPVDYEMVVDLYKLEKAKLVDDLNKYMDQEIEGMKTLALMMK